MRIAELSVIATLIVLPWPVLAQDEQNSRASIVRPMGEPQGWVLPSDYPTLDIMNEIEGATGIYLNVDADGFPTKCTVTRSSGSERLDRIACDRLLERARFYPARNDAGDFVSGSYSTNVAWQMPDREPVVPEAHFELTFVVDEAGETRDCTVVAAVNVPDGMQDGGCFDGLDFLPLTDEDGVPVATRIRVRFEVTHEEIAD